jgi:hypothetical protein
MSRSGYSDEGCDSDPDFNLWQGAVARAIKGRRGQAFLRELIEALDALPTKRLITGGLECDGEFCALGAVGHARGLDMGPLKLWDDENPSPEKIGEAFGIARSMAAEVMYENDEGGYSRETAEMLWTRMRGWAVANLQAEHANV